LTAKGRLRASVNGPATLLASSARRCLRLTPWVACKATPLLVVEHPTNGHSPPRQGPFSCTSRNRGAPNASSMGFRFQPPGPTGRIGGPSSSQPAGAVSHSCRCPRMAVLQNPNMRQRTVLQHLSLAEWRVVDRLPVSVSELTLSKLLHHGWIESRGEGHHMAIRLTPAGLEAMRSPV